MSTYFNEAGFRFLRDLARHNEREWFQAHKAQYEAEVRQPFLRLITDLQPLLAAISPHYRADPKPLGGSLFRIQRDTRFANDKRPYKDHAGAQFFHARGRKAVAPVFYLHLQPGACFVAAGLWQPDAPTLRKVRDFIVDNPGGWKAAVQSPAFRRRYAPGGESLSRPPRGYPADHPLIDDLKRKDFIATAALEDELFTGKRLLQAVDSHFQGLAPLVDYLCAALDLEF